MVPFHIVSLVYHSSPYWKFIPLNFQVASPRSFSICLRIHIPGKWCDVSSTSRSGRRAWPLVDQQQWEKNASSCPGIYQPRWHLGWRKWLRVQGKEAQENLRRGLVQFRSVAQSCPTLCDPMDCNTPGFPAHHQLAEFTKSHVHRVSDAIQPSHPLSFPSPPTFNLSQHQGLFQ